MQAGGLRKTDNNLRRHGAIKKNNKLEIISFQNEIKLWFITKQYFSLFCTNLLK